MPEGKAIEVTDADFVSEVLESDVPVLVDFWAPWCGPCKAVAPVLDKVAGEYEGQLKVCKINVDVERQTANQYGIMSVPRMFIIKDGALADQITGVTPTFEADLKEKLQAHL